jgi:hypothetical protein
MILGGIYYSRTRVIWKDVSFAVILSTQGRKEKHSNETLLHKND